MPALEDGRATISSALEVVVTERGLQFRPDPKSPGAKITAPRSNAYLVYVHPLEGTNPVSVTFAYRTWAEHFPIAPTLAREVLGSERSVPPESAVQEIRKTLDRALAAVRDTEQHAGEGPALAAWLREATPAVSALLTRLREWSAATGYDEHMSASSVSWGPTPRRSVLFLYPGDATISLDLDYAQRHGKRAAAKDLLELIRSQWDTRGADFRWQPMHAARVLERWPDFAEQILAPLARLEPATDRPPPVSQ